jgi:hypothetical protein
METFLKKIQAFAGIVTQDQIQELNARGLACEANLHNAVATSKPGNKYWKVDIGRGGRFMVDLEGNIFGIKAYGKIHKGHAYGTLDTVKDWYWGEYYPRPYSTSRAK